MQFLIDGSTLTILGVDMHGNLRVYAFDPADPLSLKGKKLLGKAIFHLGSKVSRVLRITAKANADAASPAAAVSRKVGCCLSTYDTALGMVLPLDETTYKRLRSLQQRLVTATVQPAGLNPLAHRHAHGVQVSGHSHPPPPLSLSLSHRPTFDERLPFSRVHEDMAPNGRKIRH